MRKAASIGLDGILVTRSCVTVAGHTATPLPWKAGAQAMRALGLSLIDGFNLHGGLWGPLGQPVPILGYRGRAFLRCRRMGSCGNPAGGSVVLSSIVRFW